MSQFVHSRQWAIKSSTDNGALHAMGNGRMLVYGQGPNLTRVWGSHYTSTNLLTLTLVGPERIESVSSRERLAPIWQHQLQSEGQDAGLITDVVDSNLPCMVRRIQTRVPLRFSLNFLSGTLSSGTLPSTRYPGMESLFCIHPVGSQVYGNRFQSVAPQIVQIVLGGRCKFENEENGNWQVICEPGDSEILIAGGGEYPDCLEQTEEAMALGCDTILSRTRQHWSAKLGKIVLPETSSALGASIAQAAEDTALIIATQQSEEGGVVAGHNYCLAYVRDQYGMSRALLAIGMVQEARAILDFYWRIFQREGIIHNAQSIGPYTRFHVHENDDVEMTGWLLI